MLGPDFLLTSQMCSPSTSLALSPPWTPLQVRSPTGHRSCTSSPASTRCSTSWTTRNWACEYNAYTACEISRTHLHLESPRFLMLILIVFFIEHRSGVNLAIRDNNGSFISTLSMRLYKVRPAPAFSIELWFFLTSSDVILFLLFPCNRTNCTKNVSSSQMQDWTWRPRFTSQL